MRNIGHSASQISKFFFRGPRPVVAPHCTARSSRAWPMSDAAAPAAAAAAAGPSNIDDPLEREKWIEEAIENDPVLVRRRDIIKVLSNESTAKMAQVNEMNAQLKQLEKMHGELTHPKASSKNTALAKK